MITAKRANALLWTGNVLLILGILPFALHERPVRKHPAPEALPPKPPQDHSWDTQALARLINPLLEVVPEPVADLVCLIGTDRIAGDVRSETAYLFIASRKLHVNAYVGEPIRDIGGREVPEFAGWRLKAITSKGAVFATPHGDRSLELVQGPATVATAAPRPDDARTDLDIAADLFKDGRVEDACVMFEEALRRGPSCDAVYAFFKRAGEEVLAAMLNSKDEKLRMIGYRLFELAKPGGDRRRTANV
ncbi:MAG TPA: hypothetical protein VJU16_05670 [Planctomycetota bacterium]|nr:hypothetical protein [Planctomycetota bacterium]